MSGYVTLGIDQAKTSGWAVLSRDGLLMASGVATTCTQRHDAVRQALAYAAPVTAGVPLVAVLEDHSHVPLRRHSSNVGGTNPATVLGMGAARGRWEELLDLHGIRHATVATKVFRKRVLGLSERTKADRAKRVAVSWAAMVHGVSAAEDEAEAIAIAHWGAHASEVARLAAMRRRSPVLGGMK